MTTLEAASDDVYIYIYKQRHIVIVVFIVMATDIVVFIVIVAVIVIVLVIVCYSSIYIYADIHVYNLIAYIIPKSRLFQNCANAARTYGR